MNVIMVGDVDSHSLKRPVEPELEHAHFVSSENGTSALEILEILFSISITPLLASLVTPWVVPSKFIPMAFGDKESRDVVRSVIEYPIVMILPLLFITVLAQKSEDVSFSLPTILVLMCVGIIIVNHAITRPRLTSLLRLLNRVPAKVISPGMTRRKDGSQKSFQIPFFTTFRATVIYLSVLSILAVDFKIFPRRFAKTKLHGFSLMDLGTGSFIFANGIVSSEAKRNESNFRHTMISSIPLLVLAFIRLLSVKGLEYQEVVEEYGVHWNFFFTLALVKIFSAIFFGIIHPRHTLKFACIVGISYDLVLVLTGLQNEYLLNPSTSRNGGLIDANREGIFSTIGYFSIYLFSVYCGQLIYAHKTPLVTIRDWLKYGLVSGSQIILLWVFTYFTHIYWNPSCRRVGNFTYVLWSISTNYSILWLHLAFYLVQHLLQHLGVVYGPLLYYQVEVSDKTARLRRIKEDIEGFRIRDEAKWRVERDEQLYRQTEMELTQLEGKLGIMEKKLKNNDGGGDNLSQQELEALVYEMEEELVSIRQKCINDKTLFQVLKSTSGERGTTERLAYLPDLTLPPITLSSVAYNGLAVFLIGNLLTGVINSMIVSMYAPDSVALLILLIYATIITFMSLVLYFYKIQFKFW